jgi:hypothetical protein
VLCGAPGGPGGGCSARGSEYHGARDTGLVGLSELLLRGGERESPGHTEEWSRFLRWEIFAVLGDFSFDPWSEFVNEIVGL